MSAANINGLILLGAESPIEAVRPEEAVMMALSMGEPTPEATEITHKTQPRIPTERMLFIHSSQDRVIHHSQIEQLAEAWGGVEFILLHCDAHPEQPNVPWAADLQHDFLTHDMLTSVVSHVFDMVSKCDGSN